MRVLRQSFARKNIVSFRATQKQFYFQRLAPFLYLAFVLFSPPVSKSERLPVKTYTVADGLLRDNVFKIRPDSRGFLWFCTAEGISRFDGYAFTNFTTADGLPERHVNDFLETRSGAIYIATDGGLARLNPTGLANSPDNPFFTVMLPDNPKAKQFNILFEDENGAIWAGTSGGLYKLSERDGFEAVDLSEPPNRDEEVAVSTIIKDRRGAMWIGTEESGLFRLLPNGEVERFTTANGLPDAHLTTLLEDKTGRVWVGSSPRYASGLILLVAEPRKNQKIVERFFTTKDGLPSDWITDLYEDEDKFWIATTRGLCWWQGANGNSVCKTYTAKNDLCDYDVWTVAKDKNGNLWTGTRCGAKKLARYGFTSYGEADGTANRLVNSIFENAAGELFVSFNDGKGRPVSRFDGEKFELVKPNFPAGLDYFGWGWKQTVLPDSAGDWWFPTGSGLYRFPKPARFADLAKALPQRIDFGAQSRQIFRLYEDSRGDVWVVTTGETINELWRWERANNIWRDFTKEAGFGKNRIGLSFVEDHSGNLWIGTGDSDSALIRYREGQFRIFDRNDGVPEGWLRDLFVDRAGRLWIAEPSVGLLRLDDVNAERLNFLRYTPAEGLSSIGVACLTEDEFGRIYIGTGRGLDRLNPATGQIENFTTADGLPNSSVEIAYRDRKNNLWFGTTDGLARFVPEPERAREPPNVLITGLRVNGEAQSVSILGERAISPLELNSDQKQISVDFLGLGASPGETMKYEYRLNNAAEWTKTSDRTVNFANLNAGEYLFEIRTLTADRLYSQSANAAFRIAAPVWKRPWFIALILLSTALLIYFFYKNRLTRLLEMERMRTGIATDLHDDIGANLTRIALLSEVASRQIGGETVKNLLPSIAEIARESVASMNDIVWAIAPEHDGLLDLTRRMRQHAEEVFALRDIDLEFHAPTDSVLKLSVGIRRDVLLIFKEAVNNAARHSECTKVAIDFRVEKTKLFLQIKDDGVGFAANSESDGQGLRSMTRRAKALGGGLTIASSSGTSVRFELLLPKIRQF